MELIDRFRISPWQAGRAWLVPLLALLAALAPADTARAVPNVVVIVTDDQRTEGTMDTPAMAKTRAWFETGAHPDLGPVPAGTRFPNGVTTTPLCCPARSTILTGQYAHNHGVQNNGAGASILDDKTLQEYLKPLGYRTGLFGKYLNLWDEKPEFGGDPTMKCTDPGTQATVSCWDEWVTFENQYFPITVNDQGTKRRVLQYSTDYVADRAESFIDASGGDPFFLYVAPSAPHDPWTPEPDYENAPIPSFDAIRSDPKFLEPDRSDKPRWGQVDMIGEQQAMTTRAAQLRTMYSVDDLVDGIIRKLREVPGRDENTLMFFVGDNGFHWGDHGREGKLTPYEDSVKVPIYMRWPSRVPAGPDASLAANVDVAPTILDAVDVAPAPSEPLDGQSLIDPAERDGAGLLKRNHQFLESFTGRRWKSVRTPEFVYTESFETNGDLAKEYYDLTEDPSEVVNLLGDGDPANDPPTGGLHDMLEAEATCVGAACPGAAQPAAFPADTKVTVGPDPNTNRTTADFVVTSSVPDSSFECRLSPAPGWSDCGGAGAPYVTQVTGLGPGSHTLEVRARAPGGAPDATPAVHTWTVDSTPDTSILTRPPKLTNSTTAQLTFDGTGSLGFECRLEEVPPTGGPWQPCASPATYSGLGDGTHRFSVRALGDPTEAMYEWQVDTTPPVVTIGYPTPGVEVASTELTFVPRSDGPVQGFTCKLDAGAEWPCGGAPDQEVLTGLSEGEHTLRVTARDFAGNASVPVDHDFSVDTEPSPSSTPEPGPAVTDPSDDAEVRAVIGDGAGGWYVGGLFSSFGGVPRSNVAHVTAGGAVDGWAPMVGGAVNALRLAADGTLYVVGEFLTVNGLPRGRTAAFSSAGTLLGWNPDADGDVNDIRLGSDFAYLAGDFNLVSGAIHRRIAQVSLGGAGAATSWGRLLNNAFQSGPLELHTLELTGSSVYAGGSGTLSDDGSQLRKNLAEISRATGAITNWRPQPDGAVRDLTVSPDGSSLFVGGSFATIGGGTSYSAAEVSLASGSTTGYRPVPRAKGGTPGPVNAVAARDLAPGAPPASRRWSVVIGGTFIDLKSRYERINVADTAVIGDPSGDGYPSDWDPRLDDGETVVNDLAIGGGKLAVAGNFAASHFTVGRDLLFFDLP